MMSEMNLQRTVDTLRLMQRARVPEEVKAINIAIRAINHWRQIGVRRFYCDQDGEQLLDRVECPRCARTVDETEMPLYCPHCGQKLDWSE